MTQQARSAGQRADAKTEKSHASKIEYDTRRRPPAASAPGGLVRRREPDDLRRHSPGGQPRPLITVRFNPIGTRPSVLIQKFLRFRPGGWQFSGLPGKSA